MYKVERKTFVPMDFVDVVFKPPSYKPWLPDKVIPILNYPHTEAFEVYTPNSVGPRNRWKSFEHYKAVHSDPSNFLIPCRLAFDAIPAEYKGEIPGGNYCVYAWPTFGDPGLPISGLPGFYVITPGSENFIPAPTIYNELEARAMKAMLPGIKAELSLVNSIIELKDFRTLPRTVRRVVDLGKHLYQAAFYVPVWIRKYGRNYASQTLRALFGRSSRATADSYLQTQFNFMPLLSDITGIHSSLTRLEHRINEFLHRAGRTQVRHYNFTWDEFNDETTLKNDGQFVAADPTIYEPANFYEIRRRVWYEPTTFHAEIRYNYLHNAFQAEHARLFGLLDSLGVNVNPAIIWNAIPWSFLVDWVLGVSRWLDQFKIPWMDPTINIQSYLWSVKRKRRISISRRDPGTNGGLPGPEVAMPLLHETAYRRQVTQVSNSSILSSGLSLKEVSLGAALAISRRRRRRK